MKRLLGLLLLVGLVYGGYIFYGQYTHKNTAVALPVAFTSTSSVTMTKSNDKLSELASVLGARVTSTYENGKEFLSNATNGASEPIINELITKTSETLKDLPRREAEKIKYEFCKGVVTEYESK